MSGELASRHWLSTPTNSGGKGSFTLPAGLRGPGEKNGTWEVVPVAHSLAALARRTPGFDLLRQSYPLQPWKLKHKVQANKKNLAVAVG